ncbi:MAG: Fic family protein [Bdellovibrionales bacterium]|nr:Fic family protein [Bdellovibrionales bacterium]
MANESDGSSVSLFKQLEVTRFDRALAATETLAQNRSLLTTMELERLNGILNGKPIEKENAPSLWRDSPVTLSLPSGRTETLSILRDPKLTAREHLHEATELAENGHAVDAAVSVYVKLVLSHVFKDANRRTAVLAAHYFLARYGAPLSGLALHEIGLGDLREPGQIDALKDTISQMAKFAAKRKKADPT